MLRLHMLGCGAEEGCLSWQQHRTPGEAGGPGIKAAKCGCMSRHPSVGWSSTSAGVLLLSHPSAGNANLAWAVARWCDM